MLWLFGQIWLWLLVAFVLGAATAAFLVRTKRRPAEPEISPSEQTQRIPPPPDEYVDPEPDRGRQTGTLPTDWPPAS